MDDEPPERRYRDLERFLESERTALLRVVPAVISAMLAILTVLGMVLLRPTGSQRPDLTDIGVVSEVYEGVVDRVEEGACSYAPDDPTVICATVSFRLTQGPDGLAAVAAADVHPEDLHRHA